MKSALYDQDFYAWSNQQAALLRAGDLARADIERIAWEIESMGKTEKRELATHLQDNPSLKAKIGEAVAQAYDNAVLEAVAETGLAETTFPASCPYDFGQVMDEAYWPD